MNTFLTTLLLGVFMVAPVVTEARDFGGQGGHGRGRFAGNIQPPMAKLGVTRPLRSIQADGYVGNFNRPVHPAYTRYSNHGRVVSRGRNQDPIWKQGRWAQTNERYPTGGWYRTGYGTGSGKRMPVYRGNAAAFLF
jgi:hypothetical protein